MCFPILTYLLIRETFTETGEQNVKYRLKEYLLLVLQKHLDQIIVLLGEAQKYEFHPFPVF